MYLHKAYPRDVITCYVYVYIVTNTNAICIIFDEADLISFNDMKSSKNSSGVLATFQMLFLFPKAMDAVFK